MKPLDLLKKAANFAVTATPEQRMEAFNNNLSVIASDPVHRISFGGDMVSTTPFAQTPKLSNEQMIEKAGGWQPGLKEKFDLAMLNNDASTVKSLLPNVPRAYQDVFKDRIIQVLKPLVSGIPVAHASDQPGTPDDPNSPNFQVQYMSIPNYSSSAGGENVDNPNTGPSASETAPTSMSLEPVQRSFWNILQQQKANNEQAMLGYKNNQASTATGSILDNLPIYPNQQRAQQRQQEVLNFIQKILGMVTS